MDELEQLKKEFKEILNDGRQRDTLNELVDADFEFVGRNGQYMVMADCYGTTQHYDPKTDTVLPFIERREEYHE